MDSIEGIVENIILGNDCRPELGLSLGFGGGLELGYDVGTLEGEWLGSADNDDDGNGLNVEEGILYGDVDELPLGNNDGTLYAVGVWLGYAERYDYCTSYWNISHNSEH